MQCARRVKRRRAENIACPPVRLMALAALAASALRSGACTPLRSHQGYIVDADLVNSVQPGVDNRRSVLQTLGKPSFASQFNQGDWYYIARDTRNMAYQQSQGARRRSRCAISFDAAGKVSRVDRTGVEQVASIDPYGKKTPTLGRKRGFFEDLFGNIGTVGAGGRAARAAGTIRSRDACRSTLTGAFPPRSVRTRLNRSPSAAHSIARRDRMEDDHA